MADFQFDPTDGYNNVTVFPTKPMSEAEFRATMQTLLNQIRDYMNTNMIRPDHDNHFTTTQSIDNGNFFVNGNDIHINVPAGNPGSPNLWFSFDGSNRGLYTFDGPTGALTIRNISLDGSTAGEITLTGDGRILYKSNEMWHNGNSPFSKSANGYQQFGSGMMMQGGTVDIPQGVSTSVTFPLAFPNACIAAIPVIDTPAAFAIGTNGQTRTQFNIIQSSGATRSVKWMAFGY